MKQIIQYQKTGEMHIAELPLPVIKEGWVLIKNKYSVISSGTEKTSVETAQASILGKAKSRPDLVKQVMQNAKREGLKATYEKVMNRLDNYKELGYSCSGVVMESGCDEFRKGDRVACAGATANHSEWVSVPKNLVAKVPEGVKSDEAAFTTLGAIALQGLRQADVRLGENVVVVGLGLLGIITVQLLKANGCRVMGLDVIENNFELAKKFGCEITSKPDENSKKIVETFTNGYGADAVILTASTKSNEPMEMALGYARRKSKIVVVGTVGMNISRSPFYEKEVEIRISCSYGPGRYDREYEEWGLDYPYEYVRWTENRNMQAILNLLSERKISFKELITHRFGIDDGLKAYDIITGKVIEKYLAILISFSGENNNKIWKSESTAIESDKIGSKQYKPIDDINVGFIGAGNFAQTYILPIVKRSVTKLSTVVTSEPVNASSVATKFGFEKFDTDKDAIIKNVNINTVFIATRHDSHSGFIVEALKAGKNVYVEKPLAINIEQLEEVKDAYNNNPGHLMVGFNRRFSNPFKDIKKFFNEVIEPKVIIYRVNAGFIPMKSWVQDPLQGGRVIGEGCHFIDVMQYITRAKPVSFSKAAIQTANVQEKNDDNINILITFSDGSTGNLIYLANGDSGVEKEYCEVSGGGKTAIMKNFKVVELYENGKKKINKYDGKKGHKEELEYFLNLLKGKAEIYLDFDSMYATTKLTIMVDEEK